MISTIVLPDFDLPTRSASGFILRYISPRIVEPAQLLSLFARRATFNLFASRSDFLLGVGHGDEYSYGGQNEEDILVANNYDPHLVEGKVIKLLACRTGVVLGPDLIQKGATAYMGYVDDYVWIVDADLHRTPWSDPYAATCMLPVINGLNALLDGATCQEAFNIEICGYQVNAEIEEDELMRSCLEFNYENAILLGDPGAVIHARPDIRIPLPPPPIFF